MMKAPRSEKKAQRSEKKARRSHKKPWFQFLARHYAKRRLNKHFSDLRLLGAPLLVHAVESGPAIIACNHVAWWDPLVLVQLETWLKADASCLMDAASLRELPFFRALGALPLDRSQKKQGYRDMLASLEAVTQPGQLLIIFPQGKQTPAHHALEFYNGVSLLAERSGLPIYPLGLRYDYGEGPRQIVHLALGAPLNWTQGDDRRTFTHELEAAVSAQLLRIDDELRAPETTAVSLLGRKRHHDQAERVPLLAATLRKMGNRS